MVYVMKNKCKRTGSVLVMAVVAIMIMTAFGVGMLAIAYGTRQQAIQQKNEAAAMLAAEAGYEKALFWMSQQRDMLTTLYNGSADTSGTIAFTGASCDYEINFHTFINSRPVFRIVSNGHSGQFNRIVDTFVVQAISGWAMGMCRVPTSTTSTQSVNFATGEIIDMPLHINKYNDSGSDARDIAISGTPRFLQSVAMGESRYTSGGSDKYSGVLSLFEGGIYFNQPDSRVSDEETVQAKISRFENSTASAYKFTPTASTKVTISSSTTRYPAVQLEFFVDGGVGKVRITNNCTVYGIAGKTYDYQIVPGSTSTYKTYKIYAYHYKNTSTTDSPVLTVPIEDTYVSQSFNGIDSEPGGQIYVKGNVVIGSQDYTNMVVKGKITIVAERCDDDTGGNIWIADAITVDGDHDANGLPSKNNPNVLGLIAQGLIKVVNPKDGPSTVPTGLTYQPIGIKKYAADANTIRYLPHDMIVEAAIIVGGGGWGAEYVGSSGSSPTDGRREYNYTANIMDNIIVRGAITESCRGVVGSGSAEGFLKKYYLDKRLLEGILPGDIGLQGKYIPAPAGWHDYRN
jgi:hypothetical protein